jgi:hypothetical protein
MQFDDDDRPITGQVNIGAGLSYEFAQDARAFLFAEAMAVVSDRFDDYLALGAGPSGGVIIELTEKWRMALRGRALAFTLGSTCGSYDISLEQAIDLTPPSNPLLLFGSPARTRTADSVVNSHLLCRLSYWGINRKNTELPKVPDLVKQKLGGHDKSQRPWSLGRQWGKIIITASYKHLSRIKKDAQQALFLRTLLP